MIHDADRFSQDIIPTVYKHNNWNSFIRQLNDYGFKKLKTQTPNVHKFQHPHFHRDQRNLLSNIKRRKKSYGIMTDKNSCLRNSYISADMPSYDALDITKEMQPLNLRLNSLLEVMVRLFQAVKILLDYRDQQNLLTGANIPGDLKK